VNLAKTLIHRLALLGGRKARLAPTSPIDAWPPQEWRHSH
jgi:hypothetical protein